MSHPKSTSANTFALRIVSHGDRGHGPVRGTSKSRGGFGLFRYPQTIAEKRLNTSVGDEPAARSARNCIPTAWDDLVRRVDRNWKSQRKVKKQWQR